MLNGDKATAAKVRVLIDSSDGHGSWRTVGVSDNILDASFQALEDSINYKLLCEGRPGTARLDAVTAEAGNVV